VGFLAHESKPTAFSGWAAVPCCPISKCEAVERTPFRSAALFKIVSENVSFDSMFELLEAEWGVAEINGHIERQRLLIE